jgi:urease accessory protein
MRASAHLAVAQTADSRHSKITRLHSEPPLVFLPTKPFRQEPMQRWNCCGPARVHVSLVAGAAGPIGGDHLSMSIKVETGAALVLRNVAATLVLPGPHGQPSRTEISVRVAARGALVWLPGPVIAARNCRHVSITDVTLEPGARLFLREELLLGRHREQPGAIRQRLRVRLDDQPLLDQELAIGLDARGWDGPAVIGGRRALGSVLIVDPNWLLSPFDLATPSEDADTALMPLSGPAVLVTALARDGLALRSKLDDAIAAVEASLAQDKPANSR